MGKKKEGSKSKDSRPVVPDPVQASKGRLYVCRADHDDPQEGGFKTYRAGDIEAFEKTPPAAFWRPQNEIKERMDIGNGTEY